MVVSQEYCGCNELSVFENACLDTKIVNIAEHIEAETKWPPFRWRCFQMHFIEWKFMNFD